MLEQKSLTFSLCTCREWPPVLTSEFRWTHDADVERTPPVQARRSDCTQRSFWAAVQTPSLSFATKYQILAVRTSLTHTSNRHAV